MSFIEDLSVPGLIWVTKGEIINSRSQLETFSIERKRCGFIIQRWGSTGKSFY